MTQISDAVHEMLGKKAFAHLATLMPDGSPHVTPVWIESDGDEIVFNTVEGRQKPTNLRRDNRVAISVIDPDDPYAHIMIRGEVVEITPEGAEEHIDKLAKRYLDEDTYPFRQPGEQRLIVRVKPTSITTGP